MAQSAIVARGLSVLYAVSCAFSPESVAAQEQEERTRLEQARALFLEARALLEAGRVGEACTRYEQSLRLEAGIGTKVNLADCWERMGRTASAQAAFSGAAVEAELAGQTERAEVIKQRVLELEGRVPKLSVEVEEKIPGLSVRVERVVLEEADWGAPRPMDPGSYQIEARAPGYTGFSRRVELPASGALIIIVIPPLAEAQRVPAPEAWAPGTEAQRTGRKPLSALTESSPGASRSSVTNTALLAGLGLVGVGGLALGTYYGLQYRSRDADARTICADGGVCTRADITRHDELVDESRRMRTGAYIGFGVGAAAFTGAAILYFTTRSKASAPRVGALVLPDGSWGVRAESAF